MTTDTVSQFLHRDQAGRLNDVALAMNPMRLNRVEPWALAGQVAGEDADASALLPDLSIVRLDPVTHFLSDVQGGVVPDYQQRSFADLCQLIAVLGQVLRSDATDQGRALLRGISIGTLLMIRARGLWSRGSAPGATACGERAAEP